LTPQKRAGQAIAIGGGRSGSWVRGVYGFEFVMIIGAGCACLSASPRTETVGTPLAKQCFLNNEKQ